MHLRNAVIQKTSSVKRWLPSADCSMKWRCAIYRPEARTAWELQPMQVERFAIHDAGRRVIDCIESHLEEASPDTDLLRVFTRRFSVWVSLAATPAREMRNARR